MKFNNFLRFFIIISILSSCKSPIEPPIDDTPAGKRDYTWSIDSVDYGNLPGLIQLESIWGSSPTDVWGAGYTSDVRDCLWHFDGIRWRRATEGTPIITGGGGSRIVGRVWGTSSNDVWAIGGRISSTSQNTEPFVMHYEGTHWSEVIGDISNMPSGCTTIYGVKKDEFWVSDLENITYYNNGKWTKYFIGPNLLTWGITGWNGNIYAAAYDISTGGNKVIIILIKNGQISIVDETTLVSNSGDYNGKFEPSKLWISSGKIYTAWHKISSTNILDDGNINQSGWSSVLNLPEGQFFVNTFNYSKKSFFVSGYPNLLYHYNGTDWMNLFLNIDNGVKTAGEYSTVWSDGSEIFVCDKENGIIYHGK